MIEHLNVKNKAIKVLGIKQWGIGSRKAPLSMKETPVVIKENLIHFSA